MQQHSRRSRAQQASGGGRSCSPASLSDREDFLADGSAAASASSATVTGGVKDRRRELHTQAEQKRRDAIKHGYDKLYELVGGGAVQPGSQAAAAAVSQAGGGGDSPGAAKALSKASILQRSIRHMEHLARQNESHERELDRLRKEVMALKIMKMNYEHMVSRSSSSGPASTNQQQQPLPDELKFAVFQTVMDQLFQSFDASTSAGSFAELSGCVISWLEDQCRPQTLHELSVQALQQVLTQYSQQQQQARLA